MNFSSHRERTKPPKVEFKIIPDISSFREVELKRKEYFRDGENLERIEELLQDEFLDYREWMQDKFKQWIAIMEQSRLARGGPANFSAQTRDELWKLFLKELYGIK